MCGSRDREAAGGKNLPTCTRRVLRRLCLRCAGDLTGLTAEPAEEGQHEEIARGEPEERVHDASSMVRVQCANDLAPSCGRTAGRRQVALTEAPGERGRTNAILPCLSPAASFSAGLDVSTTPPSAGRTAGMNDRADPDCFSCH